MGFLISHLNRYSDWTLEELNTFDICKFQSWGTGNRNKSYLNVKIRRYLRKHKLVTVGGVSWPQPALPRYVVMIDGCPVAGSRLSLPPPRMISGCDTNTAHSAPAQLRSPALSHPSHVWLLIQNLYLAYHQRFWGTLYFLFLTDLDNWTIGGGHSATAHRSHETSPEISTWYWRPVLYTLVISICCVVISFTSYSPPLCFSSVLNQRPQRALALGAAKRQGCEILVFIRVFCDSNY